MDREWNESRMTSETKVLSTLGDLIAERQVSRGQSAMYEDLLTSIDRSPLNGMARAEKLTLERKSIELFKSTARFFASTGEQAALLDDVSALMVLRHYGVPTRLLDWSLSPYVAAYFAVRNDDGEDGIIWSFDYAAYAVNGRKQWEKYPETCINRDPEKFDAKLTMFKNDSVFNWFVLGFYGAGFPRQNAQSSAYSLTLQFESSHADAISELLGDKKLHRKYRIPGRLKEGLRKTLRDKYGIWQGSLFPDTPGAAEFAGSVFPKDSCRYCPEHCPPVGKLRREGLRPKRV